MARTKALQADNDAPAKGHNSSDQADRDRKVLFHINRRIWLKAMEAKKAADAAVKNAGKGIKADLGEYGLAQIKAYEKAQTAEGKAELQARQIAERQAMAWAGVPINTQLDLLTNLAPLEERAYRDGEDAGLSGETFANPYNPLSPEGKAFENGWKAGQSDLFEGIKKKEAEASTDELITGHEDSDDPFADDASRQEAE